MDLYFLRSEYDRLNVSFVSSNKHARRPSTHTKLALHHESSEEGDKDRGWGEGERDRDRDEEESERERVGQDPDLLSAVMSAAEREAQPLLDRLRAWGQQHKEALVQCLAPLWLSAVLLLARRPSPGLLLLFTAFSVAFGSIFAPYQKVHRD